MSEPELKKLQKSLRSWMERYERTLIILAAATVLGAVLMNLRFSSLEANLYDLRVARNFQLSPDPSILLVSLDEASANSMNELLPLSMEAHARFLEKVSQAKPRALAYLVDFNNVQQADAGTPEATRFLNAAQKLMDQGSVFMLATRFDPTGEVLPPYPLSTLPHAVARIHKDGNVFAEDKVTRRAILELEGKPVLHAELVKRLKPETPNLLNPAGSYVLPEIQSKYFFFRYHGADPYPRVSFADVANGLVPAEALRNKIILVGTLSRDDISNSDFTFTPYTHKPFTHSKLSVHADIIDSLLNHQSAWRPSEWINWGTTISLIALVIHFALDLRPVLGVVATLGLAVTFSGILHLLFAWSGLWLQEAQPLVGIFLGYYVAVPYRLVREYRKRWEYQRRNQILTQVEELKTNFLNLVTHDLKTPVARIQGLAEVVMRKGVNRLTESDKENLADIVGSTDELNRFISSILELSKVESDRLRLQLESKDVNQLIERSVEGFKASARVKQIRIQTALEPLFPIRLDPRLIDKVVNNLIDNAIKYSAPGTVVKVESREVEGFVEILVRDQGVGLSEEERENLFSRFYRAKNDATATVAGTGLGLYLTRYFVEAHRGSVEVESAPGRGSVFKIKLPLELPEILEAEPAKSPGLKTRLRDFRERTLKNVMMKES